MFTFGLAQVSLFKILPYSELISLLKKGIFGLLCAEILVLKIDKFKFKKKKSVYFLLLKTYFYLVFYLYPLDL